ncbi:TPA: hypothetical protein ACIU15_002428 [Yersinia enterocolitica]|uniref:hypothetical protein n=1 Tax=Yersinia enterocolitica TaxID=630 RepID=UPI0021E937F8|nr:hypothetical protein [Yersinia enterocolitica]ELZ1905892.1 hypothetical protein [Yersinia enterocolitica]MCV3314152.1 hypothetical protein [Yersinia enterocolitica]UYJ90891.1 hypothetical protein N4228_08280 [Yersinia enterocolitica]UYJ95071.1 hypothetical protein N4225_09060 [Yersinia enterocolitica]UYK24376.1 hypothetical protein N4223_08275 [Yersinia enterocolitica]
MNWIKKHSIEFQKDKLRILISKVNWNYNKNYIKRVLDDISKEANANGIEVFVYDYNDNIPKGFGFDGLNLQINNKWTGNMIQKKEEGGIIFNHHTQGGAALMITYSKIGQINVIVAPAKSEDSLAVHRSLILYHTYDAATITRRRIEKWVNCLFYYHRYTGVLHRRTWKDRLMVNWLKTRMYFIEYLNPKEKFTRYSGLYIPTLALVVSIIALIVSLLSIKGS